MSPKVWISRWWLALLNAGTATVVLYAAVENETVGWLDRLMFYAYLLAFAMFSLMAVWFLATASFFTLKKLFGPRTWSTLLCIWALCKSFKLSIKVKDYKREYQNDSEMSWLLSVLDANLEILWHQDTKMGKPGSEERKQFCELLDETEQTAREVQACLLRRKVGIMGSNVNIRFNDFLGCSFGGIKNNSDRPMILPYGNIVWPEGWTAEMAREYRKKHGLTEEPFATPPPPSNNK